MITASDVQFQTYNMPINEYEAEVWDDGYVYIYGPTGVVLTMFLHEIQEMCSVAAEFIEERKKVKNEQH